MRIAITGNIGSGKSTVTRQLLELLPGYHFFDFDKAVHALYEVPAFVKEVERRFGTRDRKAVSDIVFRHPEAKVKLERISSPELQQALRNALSYPDVVVEFPLLFESGWMLQQFDLTVAVVCSGTTQQQRVAARDGISPDKIRAIVGAQLSAGTKAALADVVVDTERSWPDTCRQVEEVAKSVRQSELSRRAEQDFGGAPRVWRALELAYSEPHRHYHTAEHLRRMFSAYDRYREHLHHPISVALAIWFHDYVYDTGSAYANNETNSVSAMAQVLRAHAPDVLGRTENGMSCLALAAEFILATKGHDVVAPLLCANPRAGSDARLFLDIDLEILSASPPEIELFEKNIRAEFSSYDDKTFSAGRAAALKHFVNRDNVYFSPHFAEHEASAQANLLWMVRTWEDRAKEVA